MWLYSNKDQGGEGWQKKKVRILKRTGNVRSVNQDLDI